MANLIRWFDDVGMADLPAVGGKNASLGEMRRALTPLGIRTPDGFATIADAYRAILCTALRRLAIEWAKGGRSRELFLLQARPETVHTQRNRLVLERFQLDSRGDVLVTGRSVGEKIGQGRARIIRSAADLEKLQQNEVLVTEMTDPDWEPVMKRAAAVVTDCGGCTCHAAIVSRELGIPAIVGTANGTAVIAAGDEVTVSCAEGEEGFVYRGRLPVRVERITVADVARPRTRMMGTWRIRPRRFRCRSCPTTASAWPGSSSSLARTSGRTRWHCCS